MELEMKFTERDKKLIVFLSLFLLIVGVGYFVVKPLYEKVEALTVQAEELEMQVEQTERNLAQLPMLRTRNEELHQQKTGELALFYDYMESHELDQMITELTLSKGLGAQNLTIAMPEAPYAVSPYFLYAPATEEGEQLTESEAAYAAETSDGSTQEAEPVDPASMVLYVANLSIDVKGSHDKLQDYIDLLSSDKEYPAIQVNSYSWGTDAEASIDELGALRVQTDEMLHMELAVFMQGKEAGEE